MRSRWIKVTVLVTKAQEGKDDVYVQAEHAGRKYKTNELKMSSGQKNTFWVPLDSLAPVNGKVTIKVFDWDALSADDLISIIAFDDPLCAAERQPPMGRRGVSYDRGVRPLNRCAPRSLPCSSPSSSP